MFRHRSIDAMMSSMRTTLRLDDDLLIELRRQADEQGLTLSEAVNRALRERIPTRKRARQPFRQTTRDLGRPSFDVTKANAVAAGLEDSEILRKLGGRP
jgi:antitoxin component of RelBE/YafQ-DinJ toxin-antitoxin module